ncbi:Fe-S cluster assembly protein SufD [Kitasatospora xanthocidica]|uniref:Fe-S cluster assembly protein SufD n=1 Tax=Kitasatospora xanthocidica TaxID=83382 RepID=A0A373A498_9ACTN|nr:Fe-S cluster assembly protein SufD [Kitasatospora xanthocidica]RGD62492.1 Fe-S cluster assembly protein SufD [Kitasatospora xanthocidica]
MELPDEQLAAGHAGGDVLALSTIHRFTSLDVDAFEVPKGREEDWRFTPLWRLNGLHDGTAVHRDNGLYSGPARLESGVRVEVVASGAGVDDPRIGSAVAPADRVAAQAWRSHTHALLVTVPPDTIATEPVVVGVTGPGEGTAAYGHVTIRAGRFSKATVVVTYTGSGTFADNVELVVEESADLAVVVLHEWSPDAVHVSAHHTSLGHHAKLKLTTVSLGGAVVRVSPTLTFEAPGADAELAGLVFSKAGQHIEHRPVADHTGPHCTSRVNYKCAVHGRDSRSVWIGNAFIRSAAKGTDTYVANRNILLSAGARADAVPNLEIEIGDIVGAGHASATGRFEDDQLFYLMSRGIDENEARHLVLRGFFREIIAKIGIPEVEDRVLGTIEGELDRLS